MSDEHPIDQQLAEVLMACVEELENFDPEDHGTIHWAKDVLHEYYRKDIRYA